jgi:adenylyltransferase/sulfurtransferase
MFETEHLHIETDDRFDRLRRIAWWDQKKLQAAKVLVVGAGALGNEILKNLALLGAGRIFIADLDTVETSNLSRSVLFRKRDRGRSKAEVAAESVVDIYPDVRIEAFSGDVIFELGLGVYRWADVVIAGLDNREARLHVNRCCFRVNTPWIDAATEVLQGIVRVFVPPDGPCYECTMSEADWEALKERRGCAGLRSDMLPAGRIPTTPTTASILAAMQCQEALKLFHGLDSLAGKGLVYDGQSNDVYVVPYSIAEECSSHAPLHSVVELEASVRTMTLEAGLKEAKRHLGPEAVLELNHELLLHFACLSCEQRQPVFQPLANVPEAHAICPTCGILRRPTSAKVISGGEDFLSRTFAECGVPQLDIVIARRGFATVGLAFTKDRAAVLRSLTT